MANQALAKIWVSAIALATAIGAHALETTRYVLLTGDGAKGGEQVVERSDSGLTTVRYTFKGDQLRDLPMRVAGLPILPKAYWAARNFEESSLDVPIGSGAMKVGEFKQGTYFSLVRRPDYWGKDLPVNRRPPRFPISCQPSCR